MTSPFDHARADASFSTSGFRNMDIGETRTVMLATKSNESGKPDPASREPKTITRTNRPFICDWVDSTNEELAARRPPTYFRWFFPEGYEMPPQLRDMRFYRGER